MFHTRLSTGHLVPFGSPTQTNTQVWANIRIVYTNIWPERLSKLVRIQLQSPQQHLVAIMPFCQNTAVRL